METLQISNYQLVQESDTIGLSEKESFLYFKASLTPDATGKKPQLMDRTTYYRLLARIKKRKQEMLFTLAKHLPDAHITQIESLKLIRKKLFLKFLSEGNTRLLCDLAKTLIEVERAISEYNGWTQRISEETLKTFGITEEEPSALHPPG